MSVLAGLRFTRQQQQQQQQPQSAEDSSSGSSAQVSASLSSFLPLPPLHVLYGHRRWISDEFVRLGPLIVLPLLNVIQETRDLLSSWWW